MINKPKYKIGRRLGAGVYEKCQTQKFAVSAAKKVKKGKRPKTMSDYGSQLIEKQKIRFSYGVPEKQFYNYVKAAVEKKGVNPADKLYERLEERLDNTVYRLGIAHTRALARQMVSHGHIVVNNKKISIPSHQVRIGDIIKVREGSKNKTLFNDLAKRLKNYSVPAWLKLDADKMEAKVAGTPKNEETFLNFNTVLEFYSR